MLSSALWPETMWNFIPQRLSRRRLYLQTMLPASKLSGVQCLSEFRVARLTCAMGRTESPGCSCSSVPSNPSMQASQHTWNGRKPSATASQLGDQGGWSGKLADNLAHNLSHGRCARKLDSLPQKGDDRTGPLGQVRQRKHEILPYTAAQGVDLLYILGHGHFGQC